MPTTRSLALTGGPLLNTDMTPRVGLAVSIYLLTPSGTPVKDLDGNLYFSGQPLSSANTQTDVTGAWTEPTIVFPGDLRNPDGSAVACQLVITEGSQVTVSPVGLTYASSIAVSTWYGSALGGDTLVTMTMDARTVAMLGLQGASVSIDITASAITPSGAVIIAGEPAQATTDSTGHLSIALVPTVNLNPSTTAYMLNLPDGSVWYFTVPLTGPAAIDAYLTAVGAPGMVAISAGNAMSRLYAHANYI